MIIIPGELISLITFPGVIIHEIAHRFFCDLFNIPVYSIDYFKPADSTAGHVIHARTSNSTAAFFIGVGPLIINSLLCMMISFPYGLLQVLGTEKIIHHHTYTIYAHSVLAWLGGSIGFSAIPSNQDVKNISIKSLHWSLQVPFLCISILTELGNAPYIGGLIRIGFAWGLMLIIPLLYLYSTSF